MLKQEPMTHDMMTMRMLLYKRHHPTSSVPTNHIRPLSIWMKIDIQKGNCFSISCLNCWNSSSVAIYMETEEKGDAGIRHNLYSYLGGDQLIFQNWSKLFSNLLSWDPGLRYIKIPFQNILPLSKDISPQAFPPSGRLRCLSITP